MTIRGAGDRWLAGEDVPGVAFARHERVRITTGPRSGHAGRIDLLIALLPEPHYLLRLADGSDVRVPQSVLAPDRGAQAS